LYNRIMRVKWPTGKQILLPGLLLAVAAMGALFFLQIRWMNNSLQAQNMRYRRGVSDGLNHVLRSTYEELGLNRFDPEDPIRSWAEWRDASPYPGLILEAERLDGYKGPKEMFDRGDMPGESLLFIAGSPDRAYSLVLDRNEFYGKLFLDNLEEYSGDYSYTLRYLEGEEIFSPDKKNGSGDGGDPLLRFNLPLLVDVTVDDHRLDNLLSLTGEGSFYRDPEGRDKGTAGGVGRAVPVLEVNLNEGRGSVQFEQRLRRTNLGLIGSLALILVGIYYLLFRLYREEEGQRRVEQTFVASVSHELRTPIAVIKTASENLGRGIVKGEDRIKSYGTLIRKEADRLNRMVEAVLYYSRMGVSGKTKILWEPVNPRDYTDEILSNLALTLEGPALEKELAGAPSEVLLDRDSYRLILENLVANAFLHGGGSPVRVRLTADVPSRWRLVVEDGGPGIPRREQRRIFEPFVRGKRSGKDQIRGSGLGLYLVRTASEAMGGRVILESPYQFPAGKEREGCRFTVILPVKKEDFHEPDTDDRG